MVAWTVWNCDAVCDAVTRTGLLRAQPLNWLHCYVIVPTMQFAIPHEGACLSCNSAFCMGNGIHQFCCCQEWCNCNADHMALAKHISPMIVITYHLYLLVLGLYLNISSNDDWIFRNFPSMSCHSQVSSFSHFSFCSQYPDKRKQTTSKYNFIQFDWHPGVGHLLLCASYFCKPTIRTLLTKDLKIFQDPHLQTSEMLRAIERYV